MNHEPPPKRGLLKSLVRRWWAWYALLLVASHAWRASRGDHAPEPGPHVSLPAMNDAGPVPGGGRDMRVAYRAWDRRAAPEARTARTPVILLHGSPGAAGNFDDLGPLLARDARRVIAPDLPGFGASEPDPPSLSILAHARSVLALMDALAIERAHIVGWSLGGGVALHMADLAPERVASLTMLASIGTQEDEGSGSYAVEHAKYAIAWAAASGALHLSPHFGLLDGMSVAAASMRNFQDSDMRPLRAIMERLSTPTLILHGRHDFLVRWWGAEHAHRLITPSRLVMLDASHFMPFLQPEETAAHLGTLFARHDQPGVPALRQSADFAPIRPPMFGPAERWLIDALRMTPWWALAAAILLVVAWRERAGPALVALVVATGRLDYGVAILGIVVGQAASAIAAWRRGRTSPGEVVGTGINARGIEEWTRLLSERPVRTAVGARFAPGAFIAACEAAGALRAARLIRFAAAAACAMILWSVFALIAAEVTYSLFVGPLTDELATPGFFLGALMVLFTPGIAGALTTRTGRRLLRMRFGRAARREFWPALVMYLPLAPHFLRLSIRHRGPLVFTACNPGIPGGGGIIGESKKAILDGIAGMDDAVLASEFIQADDNADRRAARALDAVASRPALGGYPLILKPDSGYRGFAVRLARSERDVRAYFAEMTAPAIVQRYHPGPEECGILWARRPDRAFENNGQPAGFIFSICRKDFPVITGDGRRSLADLIHAHPRFRFQAGVFLERWARERTRVLAPGERLRLAEAGNHCQGTLFRDGADLITPALEARIGAIARRFSGGPPGGGGPGLLDIGRFDVRYESDDALREGHGLAILELNGTTGESTNIYDPERSALWAYRVLAAQWTLMYALGQQRRRAGFPPVTLRELLAHARTHFAARAGSALSD
ncbi:MAG: alpha/beta fold hydrolase [Phycisphaerales bacterium]